jgi:hypothetical protein
MQLIEAINIIPHLQALSTAQQMLDWLNKHTDSQPDHTLYSIREFNDLFDEDLATIRLVLGTLQTAAQTDPAVAGYYDTLKTVGLDFSAASLQSMLTTLAVAGQWPPDVLTALRSLGVTPGVPQWQALGIAQPPALAEIQAILLQRTLGSVLTALSGGINDGSLTTVAEVKASADVLFDTAIANMGG